METRTTMKTVKACSGLYSVVVAALMMMMMKILTQQKCLFSFTKKSKARPTRWQRLRWQRMSKFHLSALYNS